VEARAAPAKAATRSAAPLLALVATDREARSDFGAVALDLPADDFAADDFAAELADFDFFAAFRFFVVMIPVSSSAPQVNCTSS
jgi:hypothetical protein